MQTIPVFVDQAEPNVLRLRIYVQPGASRTQLSGLHGDAIKIKVSAPPEDGRANAELCEFIADFLGCAKRQVELFSGDKSRHKKVNVRGMSPQAVIQQFESALALRP